jgi:hypothetical protein
VWLGRGNDRAKLGRRCNTTGDLWTFPLGRPASLEERGGPHIACMIEQNLILTAMWPVSVCTLLWVGALRVRPPTPPFSASAGLLAGCLSLCTPSADVVDGTKERG